MDAAPRDTGVRDCNRTGRVFVSFLSKRSEQLIAREYRKAYSLPVRLLDTSGLVHGDQMLEIDRLATIREARAHALQEAVRWGECYSFFVAPGVLNWVVPVVDRYHLWGGVLAGNVIFEVREGNRDEAANHLIRSGATPAEAHGYLKSCSMWPQDRCQQAAEGLYKLVYQTTGLRPLLLQEQRERSQQQRQIAEEIHRRKQETDRQHTPIDEEQALLSLMRAGDKKGARRILNQMLGRVFFLSANLTVIRALVIEMMGYLVRRAVEDSPFLEPIMERNHHWMAQIIEAEDFETLASVVRRALDDFMEGVYEMGYTAANRHVTNAMRYLNEHYREPVTLEAVAEATGVGVYRIAHLVKEKTGRSIIRHVHFLRIQEAKRMLEESDEDCAEIALSLGFYDQSYFTRQFRQYTGITPAKHRRLNRSR